MRVKDVYIIWTVYFDKKLSRRRGRKLPLNKSINKPTLEELIKAAQKMGLEIVAYKNARYPACWWIDSGYIIIRKPNGVKKSVIIDRLGYEIRRMRGG